MCVALKKSLLSLGTFGNCNYFIIFSDSLSKYNVLCLVAWSCPTLCNPMDCGPPGSSACGILQARTLEWLPCSPPGDLPAQGWNPGLCLLHWQADSSPLSHLDVGISPTTNRPEGAVPQKNKEKEDSEISTLLTLHPGSMNVILSQGLCL